MIRVGWLADTSDTQGGAELTQAEFRAAAPAGVQIVDCPPGDVVSDCATYVIHNCVKYTLDDLKRTSEGRVVKYWHDVGPWLLPEVTAWLRSRATHVCCSPAQVAYMGLEGARCVPPPIDFAPFEAAASRVNGDRSGAVSVGSWRNHGKAPHRAREWAAANNQQLEVFGSGPFAPPGSIEIPYAKMPALLASYSTFVFLPTVIEPFGRIVAEAWVAGCEIVTNDLVGAKYWIENEPGAIQTAAQDFWRIVET